MNSAENEETVVFRGIHFGPTAKVNSAESQFRGKFPCQSQQVEVKQICKYAYVSAKLQRSVGSRINSGTNFFLVTRNEDQFESFLKLSVFRVSYEFRRGFIRI